MIHKNIFTHENSHFLNEHLEGSQLKGCFDMN
jgi:hypothetical protein